jgi:hypothetical protein
MEEDPGTNVRRIAAAEDIGVHLVWRNLREQSGYPYHVQQVQPSLLTTAHGRCFVNGFSQNAL